MNQWSRRGVLRAGGVCLGLGILLQSSVSSAVASPGGWSQFGYDAANTGYNPETDSPRKDITPAWTFDPAMSNDFGMPVVAENEVYIRNNSTLQALDAADGSNRWTYDSATTAVAAGDENVYLGTDAGVVALARETGDEEWTQSTEFAISTPPTLVDGTLYAGGTDGIVAIDTQSGKAHWQSDRPALGSPAVGGGTMWTDSSGVGDGYSVFLLERELTESEADSWLENSFPLQAVGGNVAYEFDKLTWFDHSAAAVDGERAYIGGNGVQAVNLSTGSIEWLYDGRDQSDNGDEPLPGILVPGTPAIADETVYFGSGTALSDAQEGHEEESGWIYAISAPDGNLEWSTRLGTPINHALAVTSNTVYASGANGTVYGLDRESGTRLWEYEVGTPIGPPIVANGRVFVQSDESGLLALADSSTLESDTSDESDSGSSDQDGTDTESGDTNSEDDSSSDGGDEEETESEDGDGSGPGFGIGTVLAGLAGTGYALKHRSDGD